MRRIASVLALVVVASLAFSSVALATGSTKTTFKMEDQGSYVKYSGQVSSNSDKCIGGRIVKVFHKGVKIAETKTNAEGRWSVIGPKPPDGDEVTVKVAKKRNSRGKVICAGDRVTRVFKAA